MKRSRFVSSFLTTVLLVAFVFVVGFLHKSNVPVVYLLPQQPSRNELPSELVEQQLRRSEVTSTAASNSNNVNLHIKPIQPHHTGHVSYVTEISSDRNHLIYNRIFDTIWYKGLKHLLGLITSC